MQKRDSNEEDQEDDHDGDNENISELDSPGTIDDSQELIDRTKQHAEQCRIQKRVNDCAASLSKLDAPNHLPSLLRQRVTTIDVGQNLKFLTSKDSNQDMLCNSFYSLQRAHAQFFLTSIIGYNCCVIPLIVHLFGSLVNASEDRTYRMRTYG